MLKNIAIKIGFFLKKGLLFLWKGIHYTAVSWPKAFAGIAILLVLSYYPLGGYLSENIDKTTDYNITLESQQQSLTIETMAFLINREVNEHLWTANLPLFFPSYFLDNMPNFQQGIIEALSITASIIDKQSICPNDNNEKTTITNAAALLKYPGNIWLFSSENNIKIAPSSSSQYKKARKLLKDYNQLLQTQQCLWDRNEKNLYDLINAIRKDLNKTALKIDKQIIEHSSNWIDNQADDLFYFNQGKLYAYMIILKAMGTDFKQILLEKKQYENWTHAIRTIEDAVALNPLIVRNGKLDSYLAANHLITLGYYMLYSSNILEQICTEIKGVSLNEN